VKRLASALAAALALFFLFLAWRAGWDLPYLARVLWYRESSTDDFRWKRSIEVPASRPRPWPQAITCPAGERGGAGALAFVMVRDGQVVCDEHGDVPAAAFSLSKTVLGLVLARAVDAGTLSWDDPLTGYLPDPRWDGITLASLIDMRSGLGFDEDTRFPWVDQDGPAVYYASDLARTAQTRPRRVAPPGTFLYNDYAPNLLGLALARAGGEPLAAHLARLWADLGAESPLRWSVDEHGFAWHESGLVASARDLARVGQALLDGRPASWAARSRDPAGREVVVTLAGTPLGYRNGWWLLGEDLVGMGRHGQILLVAPATRTVIVRLGREGQLESNVAIARRLQQLAHE
jgi:CubicO group peptidase (beta-lactamase class C family)